MLSSAVLSQGNTGRLPLTLYSRGQAAVRGWRILPKNRGTMDSVMDTVDLSATLELRPTRAQLRSQPQQTCGALLRRRGHTQRSAAGAAAAPSAAARLQRRRRFTSRASIARVWEGSASLRISRTSRSHQAAPCPVASCSAAARAGLGGGRGSSVGPGAAVRQGPAPV